MSPKTKVTVPPTPIAMFAGVNSFSDVAFTMPVMDGAEGLPGPAYVDELHAMASAATAPASAIRVVRTIRVLRKRRRERADICPAHLRRRGEAAFHSSRARWPATCADGAGTPSPG